MKKFICFLPLLVLVLLGCDREEPLPLLGVEGVYLMDQVLDVNGVEQDEDDVGSSVYWFFEDRTFQKAQLKNEILTEASGTFDILVPAVDSEYEGTQFELIFLSGEEIIQGCRPDSEVIIQLSRTAIVNEGQPCGGLNFYYNITDFNPPS